MSKSESDAGGWSIGQVKEFAKRFAYTHKGAWHAYVSDVREALIDSFILLIVLGQDKDAVHVESIRSLRQLFGHRLATHHSMYNDASLG